MAGRAIAHRGTGNFLPGGGGGGGGGEPFAQKNSRKLPKFLRKRRKEMRVIYDALT